MARRRNNCCHGNAIIPFLCIVVVLHAATNDVKFSCLPRKGNNELSFKIFRTAVNNETYFGIHVTFPIFFQALTKLSADFT